MEAEDIFKIIAFVFFVATILAMVSIVREVLPRLCEEEQTVLRNWFTASLRWRAGRALNKAWDVHGSVFPKSRKRILFAFLLLGTFLAGMSYPLWLALGSR
jgi:hypothetical protein